MTQGTSTPGGGGVRGFFSRAINFLQVFWIGMKWGVVETLTRHRKINLEAAPRASGQTAVITGGARGIGAEVVKQLMFLDMHVIIGCRNTNSGIKLIDDIRKDGIQTGSAEVLTLDLASLNSVREFAQTLLDRNIPINLLINNAGIMMVPYAVTSDGYESQLQTNYLSHFLLTNMLMPLLKLGGSPYKNSRVINVSSVANYGGSINFDDINMQKMYDRNMAYMSSKLMQVVSSKHLNDKLKAEGSHVRVYSLHPGMVKTELYSNVWYVTTFMCLIKGFFRTPQQGADGIVYVAVSPDVEAEDGEYFMNCQKTQPNRLASDSEVQERLWNISQTLIDSKISEQVVS